MSSVGSMPPPGVVRVLQADGKVLHFEHPVLAIQVMQEHPGHLVVRCGPSSMSNEMIREERYASLTYETLKQISLKDKVAILRADEELNQRSTYYLLPIKSTKKVAGFSWNGIIKALKKSSKVASSFEVERKSDSSRGERKLSKLGRSRSLPRSTKVDQQLQDEEQLKPRQKLSPSVSFPPSRIGGQSLSNSFMEGVGRFQELHPLHQPQHHKRPRSMQRPSLVAWRPILESISEVVDEFSDIEDDSADFYKSQSKCLRTLDSFQSPLAHLRPVRV